MCRAHNQELKMEVLNERSKGIYYKSSRTLLCALGFLRYTFRINVVSFFGLQIREIELA